MLHSHKRTEGEDTIESIFSPRLCYAFLMLENEIVGGEPDEGVPAQQRKEKLYEG